MAGYADKLHNYTAMGKPKDLVAEIPLDLVASVDLEKKKVTANSLLFGFAAVRGPGRVRQDGEGRRLRRRL